MSLARTSTAWWALLLLAVLGVFTVAAAAISQGADAGTDVMDSCWASDLPDGVEPHDNTLRTVEITFMPAGRLCDWEAGETQTGWPTTIAALIGTAVALVVTAFALRFGGAARRVVALLPLVAIAVLWFVMWSSTLYVIID
jgi:amino acid transporter